jgi:hypothetical protein
MTKVDFLIRKHSAATPKERLMHYSNLNELASRIYTRRPDYSIQSFATITYTDILKVFRKLQKYEVEYLLVGGIAQVLHGYTKLTYNLDLWLPEDDANTKRLIRVLKNLNFEDVYYLEHYPILSGFTNVQYKHSFYLNLMHRTMFFEAKDYETCHKRAEVMTVDDCHIPVMRLKDIIWEKEAYNREKDREDIIVLQKLLSEQNKNRQPVASDNI